MSPWEASGGNYTGSEQIEAMKPVS